MFSIFILYSSIITCHSLFAIWFYHNLTAWHFVIVTVFDGLPEFDPTASIAFTTFLPYLTLPKTTCLWSSHEVGAVVRKNWLPLVSLPALAIERQKGSCLSLKFSSANLSPQIDLPPVPSPRVKSPPWIMKLGITLWNLLPWKASWSPSTNCSP